MKKLIAGLLITASSAALAGGGHGTNRYDAYIAGAAVLGAVATAAIVAPYGYGAGYGMGYGGYGAGYGGYGYPPPVYGPTPYGYPAVGYPYAPPVYVGSCRMVQFTDGYGNLVEIRRICR